MNQNAADHRIKSTNAVALSGGGITELAVALWGRAVLGLLLSLVACAAHALTFPELTVQDQPLNIYMESLLWQEDLKHPAALLGSEAGFDTNRARMVAAE